jgi:hypothetical protein
MEILKIIETLQIYSEDFIAYKLDGGFANAVTEAVSLLISQGEQIADLQNELRDERYRHDRYVDFELAEAEELRKAREAQRWIPVAERLPEPWKWVLCYCRAGIIETLRYDDLMGDWDTPHPSRCYMKGFVTHWMQLPDPPKEEYNE